MKITYKITLSAEQLEDAIWEAAEKNANEWIDGICPDEEHLKKLAAYGQRALKRSKFVITRWKDSRKIAVSYAGKLKFTISVPSPEDVEITPEGTLTIKNKEKLTIQECRSRK